VESGRADIATFPSAAELTNVTKSFGDLNAVDDMSLRVPHGQILGLIGPSGSGKTTAVRLLVGSLVPTTGVVRVLDADPIHLSPRQRARIGYTPQRSFLYPMLTARENVSFVAGLFGMGFIRRRRRIREVLRFLELWDARGRLARDLSGGMQRRLGLACALIHDPQLLVVDEPTAGLDPLLRQKIWEHLRTLKERGTTILVTTQYIDEAQQCDTVALLAHGRLIAVGSPGDLKRQAMGGEALDLTMGDVTPAQLAVLRALPEVRGMHWTDVGALRVFVDDVAKSTPLLTRELERGGAQIAAIRPYEVTFDEVFRRLVDRHAPEHH